MFGGYKFGNITKGVYNKVTNNQTASAAPVPSNASNVSNVKGYQFGDVTKSIYNKWSNTDYKFGDLTKSAFHCITGQYEPFKVDLGNAKILNEGFLYKRSSLWTYTKYWAVLTEQFLYLFKEKNQYDLCVQAIDLSLYDGVGLISNSNDAFELMSTSHDNQRYNGHGPNTRQKWINCIIKIIGVQKADVIKESLTVHKTTGDTISSDMQCVAYYIIGLEYNHSETGDPQVLLSNQNFIISMIIWSYMHIEDKVFDANLVKTLDGNQRSALKAWEQPIAVSYAISGGLKKAIAAPFIGMSGGLMVGVMMAVAAPTTAPRAPLVVLLPLSVIAGTVIQTTYAPKYFVDGFKETYNSTQ